MDPSRTSFPLNLQTVGIAMWRLAVFLEKAAVGRNADGHRLGTRNPKNVLGAVPSLDYTDADTSGV